MSSSTPASAKPTNGHPVADNAVRLLFGEGWSTMRDLRQTAKKLALQARRGPLQPPEPCADLCPRVRTAEDYAAAEKVLSDPTELAITVAFLPNPWRHPRDAVSQADVDPSDPAMVLLNQLFPADAISGANMDLLRAEGLRAGNPRRARDIADALQVWEAMSGETRINSAIDFTAHQDVLNRRPVMAEVASGVYGALAKVAERALADIYGDVKKQHLKLLSALAECRRVPEVRGLRAKEEWAFTKLWVDGMKPFIESTEALFAQPNCLTKARLSLAEVDGMVKESGDFRRAWALAQECPNVERRFRPDTASDYHSRRLLVAWIVGTNEGAWAQAGELMDGVGLEAAEENENLREVLLLARRVIPVMAKAHTTRQPGLAAQVEALKEDFPDFTVLLRKLSAGVWLLCQGQRARLSECERALESRLPPSPTLKAEIAPPIPPLLPQAASSKQTPAENFLGQAPGPATVCAPVAPRTESVPANYTEVMPWVFATIGVIILFVILGSISQPGQPLPAATTAQVTIAPTPSFSVSPPSPTTALVTAVSLPTAPPTANKIIAAPRPTPARTPEPSVLIMDLDGWTYNLPSRRGKQMEADRKEIEKQKLIVMGLNNKLSEFANWYAQARPQLNEQDLVAVTSFNAAMADYNTVAKRFKREESKLKDLEKLFNAKLSRYGTLVR